MLKSIRANRNKFLGIFVAGVCALLMVGFGLDSFFGSGARQGPIASINGEDVSYNQFLRRYDQLRQRFQQQFGKNFHLVESQLNLKQQALDAVISDRLLQDFSSEIGLAASKAQIESQILANPYFDGKFSQAAYQNFLRAIGMTGGQLERAMAQEVVRAQLTRLFADVAAPSDIELRRMYQDENAKITLSYVSFDPSSFESAVDTSDEEALQAFFEKNQTRYVLPRRVGFSYVKFNPEAYRDSVEVNDEDLRDLLERDVEKYSTPRRIRLREIFFSLNSDAPSDAGLPFLSDNEPQASEDAGQQTADELVRAQAEAALKRVEDGEEFEKLAAELSDDIERRSLGGDLGLKTFDELEPEIRRTVEELSVGDYSRVIKTKRGYHIVLVDDYEPEAPLSFEEAKPKLIEALKKADSPLYAYEAAQEAFEGWIKEDRPLAAFVETRPEFTMVSTDGALSFADGSDKAPVPLIREAMQFELGDRDIVELDDVSYLLEVTEVVDSTVPELEEVRETVVKNFIQTRSRELAQEKANELLSKFGIQSDFEAPPTDVATSLAEAAKALGLSIENTPEISKKSTDAVPFMADPQIQTVAFGLRKDAPLAPQVLEYQNALYVISLNSRVLPDGDAPKSELEAMREKATRDSSVRLLEALLASLKSSSEISVNTEQLAGSF